jgi:hypothetical protein
MKRFILLSSIVLFCFSCKQDVDNSDEVTSSENTEEKISILTKIANAYGYENWDKVEKVKFSFVVNPGEKEMVRRWEWEPKIDKVTLVNDTNSISYVRADIKDEFVNTDKAFVNDSFWLLFPFHLVWDDIEHDVVENSTSPINKKETIKLIVKYPEEGGYTPGDKYEVYVNKNYHIVEWTYHPKGAAEPALANTFEELSNFNGIKVNKVHKNPTRGFQLNFRDISFE